MRHVIDAPSVQEVGAGSATRERSRIRSGYAIAPIVPSLLTVLPPSHCHVGTESGLDRLFEEIRKFLDPTVKRALQQLSVSHPESDGFTVTQHTCWPTPQRTLSVSVAFNIDGGDLVGRELFLILDQRKLPEMLRVDLLHRLCHFLEVMCIAGPLLASC